jgi:SOS response regulatory protein OraA/RecX
MTTRAEDRRRAAAERRALRAGVDEPDVVMAAASVYLAERSRTVHQTRAHLEKLGYRPELCGQVVARLVELGYLDDVGYARAWVEARDRSRPRGEVALRRELVQRGVEPEVVQAVLSERRGGGAAGGAPGAVPLERGAEEAGAGDAAAARRLIERRLPSLVREPDARRRRQKAYALLARNGFGPDVCREESLRVSRDATGDGAIDDG